MWEFVDYGYKWPTPRWIRSRYTWRVYTYREQARGEKLCQTLKRVAGFGKMYMMTPTAGGGKVTFPHADGVPRLARRTTRR
jgi:hypothetical protein